MGRCISRLSVCPLFHLELAALCTGTPPDSDNSEVRFCESDFRLQNGMKKCLKAVFRQEWPPLELPLQDVFVYNCIQSLYTIVYNLCIQLYTIVYNLCIQLYTTLAARFNELSSPQHCNVLQGIIILNSLTAQQSHS